MANIECTVPEELLTKQEDWIDDAEKFARVLTYSLKVQLSDGTQTLIQVAKYEHVIAQKRIPYDAKSEDELRAICSTRVDPAAMYAAFEEYLPGRPMLIEVNGVRRMADPGELDKTTRVVLDDESVWQCAVEFRLRGTDVIVKQTGDVQIKRGRVAPSSAGMIVI